jgi:hypothetical protein
MFEIIQKNNERQVSENAEPPKGGKSLALSEVQRSWDDLKMDEKKLLTKQTGQNLIREAPAAVVKKT